MTHKISPARNSVIVYVIAVLFSLSMIQCHNSKKETLQVSLKTLNGTRDGFLVWDRHHKDAIVNSATSYEDGEARLLVYIEKRASIALGFELAYKAIATAAVSPSDKNIEEMLDNLSALYESIEKLKSMLNH